MNKSKRNALFLIICVLTLFGCKKSYTTCDCADLTHELYKEYESIINSDKTLIKKVSAMRKVKKKMKKDERYKFCREQGVRPLSILYYPKNKIIFSKCDSWITMESEIDLLWLKIKEKYVTDNEDDAEE